MDYLEFQYSFEHNQVYDVDNIKTSFLYSIIFNFM